MISIKRFLVLKCLLLLAIGAALSHCAARADRFAARPPVQVMDDQRPVPIPGTTRYIRMDYYYKVLVRRPATHLFRYDPTVPARDVNSHDHVPASSWYTPRLGYRHLTPEEILRGPRKVGPPQKPLRIVSAKHLGNNPGFIIADSRDRLYLVKFDPPDYPGIETSTALITNRLFWAFGYNVPEDYLYFLDSRELEIDSTADLSDDDVALVYSRVAAPENGVYRTTVSLLIDGIYLGPIPDTGVREDDPNDLFPHENRRILRALKVFGAFTNQTDIRIDNSLDVFEGFSGKGFVKHYLLDFGEAFGGHGASHQRLWDGYTHIFSFGELTGNLLQFGLAIRDWERLEETPWKSVGAFESRYFDPATWKETYPYEPIQRALPEDCYWAAKVLAAVTRQHLKRLIEAARYPQQEAADYVLETLMERRKKVLDYYYHQVTPLDYAGLENRQLLLVDMRRQSGIIKGDTGYQIQFYDDDGKAVKPALKVSSRDPQLNIAIPDDLVKAANGYLRVSVTAWRDSHRLPRPAEFHLRYDASGELMVAGIKH